MTEFSGEPPTTIITDLHQLTAQWRTLMGPLGFSHHRLWLLFLEPDGELIRQVHVIDEIPTGGDPTGCRNLAWIASEALPDGGSFAVLLSRAGRHPMNEADRSWARELTAASADFGVRMWPMHFANDAMLQVFAPDDLIGRAS